MAGSAPARGAQDSDLLPLLHGTRGATFFTLDEDFFNRRLCHPAYCLVWLAVPADEAAEYVARVLRHPRFRTRARRMGKVVRVHPGGLSYWQAGTGEPHRAVWATG